MRHRPIVTNFRIRPVTYPEGHWMNRFWGPIVRTGLAVFGRLPIYRYVLRAHPEAEEVLDAGGPVVFACVHQDIFDTFFEGFAAQAVNSTKEVEVGARTQGGVEGQILWNQAIDSGDRITAP